MNGFPLQLRRCPDSPGTAGSRHIPVRPGMVTLFIPRSPRQPASGRLASHGHASLVHAGENRIADLSPRPRLPSVPMTFFCDSFVVIVRSFRQVHTTQVLHHQSARQRRPVVEVRAAQTTLVAPVRAYARAPTTLKPLRTELPQTTVTAPDHGASGPFEPRPPSSPKPLNSPRPPTAQLPNCRFTRNRAIRGLLTGRETAPMQLPRAPDRVVESGGDI